MTKEKNHFICRNEECKPETNSSGEEVSGGKVIVYTTPEKGQTFVCAHCGSIYQEENGNILLVFEKEVIFEDSDGFTKFQSQYETNRIHFTKLVLKNINEPDYKGKILSFNKCRIDELVIEDVKIISAFYPIIFSECRIDRIRISKSNILKANQNNYKSLWNFFGITFFQTVITKNFIIDDCKTSIAISNCAVKCSLDFSKESKIDLALIYNERDPEIKTDKNSVVKRLFEVTGRAPAVTEKKIKTSGKIISNMAIDELHVDSDIKKVSVLENCSIRNLIFEEGTDIKGRLEFKNCVIGNMQNQPSCFKQDLVFLGCTFPDKFSLKRLNFEKSLVFEVCTFEMNTVFNKLNIEEDLYLNYSVFKKGLSVSGVRIGGYIKCEINIIQNIINFEDNVVAKDINLSFINSADSIVLFHNEINGYLFLTQIATKGKLDVNMLNGEAMTINDIAIDASVEINNLVLKNDFKITRMVVSDDVYFLSTKMGGALFLFRSSFKKDFLAYDLESKLNMFMNNDFKGNGSFNSCTFRQQTWTSRNLFHDSLNWTSIHAQNTSFNDNYLFGSFTIDKTEAKDIIIDHNFTGQDIEINNSKANDISINDNITEENFVILETKANNFSFNDNKIKKEFSLKNSELKDAKFYDNLVSEDFVINDSITRDIYLLRNQTGKINLMLVTSNDLIFIENYASAVNFYHSFFADISISECTDIGYATLQDLSVSKSVTIEENIFHKNIFLDLCKIGDKLSFKNNIASYFDLSESETGDILFSKNRFQKECSISNLKSCDIKILESHFNEGLKFLTVKAADIYFTANNIMKNLEISFSEMNDFSFGDNKVEYLIFVNGNCTEISITKCKNIGVIIDSVSVSKEIKITDTTFLNHFSIGKCKTEGGLTFNDNRVETSFSIDKSELNEATFKNNLFCEDFILNNSKTHDLFINSNIAKQSVKIKYIRAFDIAINNNHARQSFEILETKANNLNFNNNKIRKYHSLEISELQDSKFYNSLKKTQLTIDYSFKGFSLKNSELKDAKFYDNLVSEDFVINDSITRDIYLLRNQTGKINLMLVTSNDLIFTENSAQTVRFLYSFFAEIYISKCKEIGATEFYNVSANKDIKITGNTFLQGLGIDKCKSEGGLQFNDNKISGDIDIRLCTVRTDIEFEKNEVQNLKLINTVANDILLENNGINDTLEINDTKADDIKLINNNVARDLENTRHVAKETNGNESSDHFPGGIMLYKCNIQSELLVEGNNTPESLIIQQIIADNMIFTGNKTNIVEIFMGKYRLINVSKCKIDGKFKCHDVSISKNLSFSNNIFQDLFIMQFCKIENYFGFIGNTFKARHELYDNTVTGSISYSSDEFAVMNIRNNKFNFFSLENATVLSTLYFERNEVHGSMRLGKDELSQSDKEMIFSEAVSMRENKIRNAMFYNLRFELPVFLHHNNFDSDLTFRDITHHKALDFTGCFVGGSFVFHNARGGGNDGDLVLDNTFIDKRISFNNYTPASFSFINATFNGFEIPRNWRMHKKELIDKYNRNRQEAFILKEDILKEDNIKKQNVPYGFLKQYYEANKDSQKISAKWNDLKENVLSNEKKKEILLNIEGGKAVLNALYYISECISKAFLPVYYGFFGKETIEALANLADYFAITEHKSNDKEITEIADQLKDFFSIFNDVLISFHKHTLFTGSKLDKKDKQAYRHEINNRLEEQYHVLRHIYGSNGELKEEDSAYYKWMHYKNISDMHRAPLRLKPKYWIKYILYEQIFGWGVDLVRILKSTGWLVVLFAAIYKVMFQINPGLKIDWDGGELYGPDIGRVKSLVLALQTTFSAILGDWAPIGAGAIKIPMTINAVLGILFVTFLIGAYGRKMLR